MTDYTVNLAIAIFAVGCGLLLLAAGTAFVVWAWGQVLGCS